MKSGNILKGTRKIMSGIIMCSDFYLKSKYLWYSKQEVKVSKVNMRRLKQ